MPYIKKKYRKQLKDSIREIVNDLESFSEDEIEGVLNYVLTTITNRVMKPEGGWRYYAINRTLGVLTAVKAEYERRVAGPYETDAIDVNGDIDVYQKFDMERSETLMRRFGERRKESEKAIRHLHDRAAETEEVNKVVQKCGSGCQCKGNVSRDT